MKLSTRNQWQGTVESIVEGAVNSEVKIKLAAGVFVVSIVTNGAVKSLDLKMGDAVVALVKASEVILGYGVTCISARNVFNGMVSSVVAGSVNTEVSIDLGSGTTITSIITKTSAEHMEIAVGRSISAIVKASSVMIGKE
jgi:molybdate transport system regulatory protein